MAANTLKGAGGKNLSVGATCLLPTAAGGYTGGTLASINDDGNSGVFKPAKPMWPGTTCAITVKPEILIPFAPPET